MKPNIILCDIDGTVADLSHRRHWIDPEIKVGDKVYVKGISNTKRHIALVEQEFSGVGGKSFGIAFDTSPNVVSIHGQIALKKIKRWDKFFENVDKDTPILPTVKVIKALSEEIPVLFMSGRPARLWEATSQWLNTNGLWFQRASVNGINHAFEPSQLIMRPDNDTREDYTVKKELYLTHVEPHYNVVAVFDDRSQVVKMWRDDLKLTCYQVAEGNF